MKGPTNPPRRSLDSRFQNANEYGFEVVTKPPGNLSRADADRLEVTMASLAGGIRILARPSPEYPT